MRILLYILFSVLLQIPVNMQAQRPVDDQGVDFWVAIGNRSSTSNLRIYVHTTNATVVTIETFDSTITRTVAANATTQFIFNAGDYSTTNVPVRQNKAIRVMSTEPVRVRVAGEREAFTDATIVYPRSFIGPSPQYLANRYTQTFDNNTLVLVAMEDSTHLVISNPPVGYPTNLVLQKFQTFPIPYPHAGPAIAVTCGKYSKPFAVYLHNSSTQIGPCNALEPLYTQLLPEQKWGKKFVYSPMVNQSAGYVLSILASENNTQVTLNNDPPLTLNRGQRFQREAVEEEVICVTANKPISCFQLLKGRDCQFTRLGDPALVELMSQDHRVTRSVFATVDGPGLLFHYVNIVLQANAVANLRINGVPVSSAKLMPSVACNNLVIYRDLIPAGNYVVTCDSGFVGYAYGYGSGESYLFALGQTGISYEFNFDFEQLSQSLCPGDSMKAFMTGDLLQNVRFVVDGKTYFGDSVRFEVIKPGWYDIVMIGENPFDAACDIMVQKWFFVQGPQPVFPADTAICGDFRIVVQLPVDRLQSFQWSDPNNQTDSLVITQGDAFWVVLTDTFGCTFTDSLVVTKTDAPTIDLRFPAVLCESLPFVFENIAPDSLIDYELTINSQTYNIRDSFVFMPTDTGIYDVRFLARLQDACSDSFMGSIRVVPNPVALFTSDTTTNCLVGNQFVFANNSLTFGYNADFEWLIDGDTLVGEAGPVLSFTTADTFDCWLKVTNSFGCSDSTDTLSLVVFPHASINIVSDTVCLGESNRFEAQVVYDGNISSYKWRLSDGTRRDDISSFTHMFAAAGAYGAWLATTTENGCVDSIERSQIALVRSLPVADFTWQKLKDSMFASIYQFSDRSVGNEPLFLDWTFDRFGSSTERNPLVSFFDTGRLFVDLLVVDVFGCEDETQQSFLNYPEMDWYFPSAFSPNGDGKNDEYKTVGGLFTKSYSLQIYNRWGEMLFETDNPLVGWDGTFQGKESQDGVYVFSAIIETIFGEKIEKRGTFTLLR
jgi:gliding motility-associated-like protein